MLNEMDKTKSHDLTLPAWGPYSKLYSGISHIPAANDGMRFDFSVMPGYFRRKVDVPNVRFESNFHPWEAEPDLPYFKFRHELEWKDNVYVDVSFWAPDSSSSPDSTSSSDSSSAPESSPTPENPSAERSSSAKGRFVRAECVNQTDEPQILVLHFIAAAHRPTAQAVIPHYPEKYSVRRARDYDQLTFSTPKPTDNLTYDGLRRGEEAVSSFLGGYGVGQGFGAPGDTINLTFDISEPILHPCLCVRHDQGKSVFRVEDDNIGITDTTDTILTLEATNESGSPQITYLPLEHPLEAGRYTMHFQAIDHATPTQSPANRARLDCFLLCEYEDRNQFTVTYECGALSPAIHSEDQFLTLKYPGIAEYYGMTWSYDKFRVRELFNDELDIFLRDTAHDHVHDTLVGNSQGHYTDVFFRPISLAPGERKSIYGYLTTGETEQEVMDDLRKANQSIDQSEMGGGRLWPKTPSATTLPLLPDGEKYRFSQQLMQAVLLTNVVYPVYTRGHYIKHNTPGRWWDSLYTWDSGFIGMGLLQYSRQRALDCLNTYLTEPGCEDAAFIHHGSPVPTQFYLFAELLNLGLSDEEMRMLFPRLVHYYLFFTGQAGSSTMADTSTGLLRPWDYFYNSGGWDDYPAQVEVHRRHIEEDTTPVVTTANAILCAKILAYTAERLGEPADRYDVDIARFSEALQTVAWDEDAGYFSYIHKGEPLRDENGVNFNMGLDGVTPLFAGAGAGTEAGAVTADQETQLWAKLMDPKHFWTPYGITTVDQQAPYYQTDGYWNGAIWMPYQWLFFKAALDAGKTDFAYQIAETALKLWQKETGQSYNCFEHFMVDTGRGCGWHQFGGLSSPVVQWFHSYYVPGTVTTGFHTFVKEIHREETRLILDLDLTRAGEAAILVATDQDVLRAALAKAPPQTPSNSPTTSNPPPSPSTLTSLNTPNGHANTDTVISNTNERHRGLWEIHLRASAAGSVRLILELREDGIENQ